MGKQAVIGASSVLFEIAELLETRLHQPSERNSMAKLVAGTGHQFDVVEDGKP